MCENSVIISFVFIIKIIVIVLIPLILFINKKINPHKRDILINVEIVILVLFIILRVANNKCIVNSSINKIGLDLYRKSTSITKEKNSPDVVEEIITNKIYKTNDLSNVYYFNNNTLPLSDKKIVCEGKSLYMKQFGNGITTVSMFVSSLLNQNIDPIEILNLSISKGIFDCNTGVDFDLLLNVVSEQYNISISQIDINDLYGLVNSGKVAIIETVYNRSAEINLTCNKGYALIYNVDNSGQYQLLSPNDTDYDYICPDNTMGSLDIISADNNKKTWNVYDLNAITSRLIVGERN